MGLENVHFLNIHLYWIYIANNWGKCVSWRVSVRPSGAGLENVHFLEYTFVLDIHCQQLGKMCQLEGVCAAFGRGVGECAFSRIYICIGYTHCQQLGKMCQFEGVCAPFGRRVRECTFSRICICQLLGNVGHSHRA